MSLQNKSKRTADTKAGAKTARNMSACSDGELLDHLREQVNMSRNYGTHDRELTRAAASEARRRGWNLRAQNKKPSTQ